MAAFVSTEVDDDKPHYNDVPPPPLQPQQHAFAHQLSPPPPPPPHSYSSTPTTTNSASSSSQPPRISHRPSGDFRHTSSGNMPAQNPNGSMPVPAAAASHSRMSNGHAQPSNMRDMAFAGPRSPPNNKSTSHVPCKFYRQGACQAGKACPFLHSDEPLTERAPCKYFTKGNCKFGPKCALAHILPNGHVVNRNNGGGGGGAGPFGRMNIPHHPDPAPNSSLLTMQAHMAPMQQNYPPYAMHDDFLQKSHYDMIPTIDTTFSSHPGSNYGSPPNENGRTPMSPPLKGLTVADVGLPASFDSQGISEMARWGPVASSVPTKFLANSPPSSFAGDSSALRNLHDSAFGNGSRRPAAALGSSPPDPTDPYYGRRIMHSELGAPRSRGMLSASVGARGPFAANDEWDDSDLIGKFEEDMLPSSLNDLLTPEEKFRRFSRDQNENDGNLLSHRGSMSRLGASPTASDMKIGSPSGATSSPSRYQSLWGKRPGQDGAETNSAASQFGHVGSPLRNSSLHPNASPSLRALPRPAPGDSSSFFASPPRQASMSMISQQLQRTRLSSRASEDGALPVHMPVHPGMNRLTSASSVGSSTGRMGIDRAVSSSSINRERIEEEQGLFSMEEEDDVNGKSKDGASTTSSTSNKRLSGLSWGSGGKASPNPAPIGAQRAPAKY
ncbi:unnamed protein product [Periconia digitata]|uniref:C3H1-type domain-containing protein n=1 Tax=Periconia digitata TaxID=1303443 RepID=A0A9W4UGG2_9PLEO|nr:unnamed protein product [Periconia digitata]